MPGFVTMVDFVEPACLESCKYSPLRLAPCMRRKRFDLLLVVQVNKGFHGFDRGENRLFSHQCRDKPRQKAGQAPQWQQQARAIAALKLVKEAQMLALRGQVLRREIQQLFLGSRRQNSPVNPHGTGFSRMTAAQLLLELPAYSNLGELLVVYAVDL